MEFGLFLVVFVAQCCAVSGQAATLSLSLGATPLANNSAVVITDIGDGYDGTSTLICTTTFRPCCASADHRAGQWYYPDGSLVPNNNAGEGFYRGRGDDGTVRLNRRSTTTSPTGTYTCELPLTSSSDLVRLTVRVVSALVSSPPSSPTIESTSPQSTSITITWTQPEGDVVDNYEITHSYQGPCLGVTQSEGDSIDGNRRQFVAAYLYGYSNYTITIIASNDAGRSPPVTTTVETLSAAPSGPPQSLLVTSTTPFSITIQWSEVECLQQNSVITGYSVRYGGMSASVTGANNRTFTATGLIPRTSYTFEVAAISESGTGPYNIASAGTEVPLGVGLLLNGVLYGNNSIVTLDEIGEYSAALFCLTNNTDCCRSSSFASNMREWYYPNGSSARNAASGDAIFRGRGPSFVRLQRRNNAQTTGVFRCEVPDASGTNQQLYVGVYPVNSGSPSITGLSYDRLAFTLTLTCTSTGGPATTVTWRKNGAVVEVDGTTYHQSQRVVNPITATYENTLLSNVDANFVGNFSCSVSNKKGLSTQSITLSVPVQITFQGISYPNYSVLLLNDIGEFYDYSAILCTTNRDPCCSYPRVGEWYYPNGAMVLNNNAGEDFYRGRGYDQSVRLSRRNNAQSPTGSFCCELPDSSDVTHRLCVTLVNVFTVITPSGSTTAGEEYTLTCSASVDGATETPSLQWLGPDDMMITTSDSLMITGTSPTSILQFNPLQSSREGNYTCQVTVGNVTEMSSIQVNVEAPVITAMVSGGTPTVGESYSLTCTVTGADRLNPTITYKWFKDTALLSGERKSILFFSSLNRFDAGQYRCRVTISSILYRQTLTAMSNTQDLTHQIPPPTTVTVTSSPGDPFIVAGSSLTLTCSIELSEAVDIAVTVNTVWSGPSDGTQFTTITSVATMMTATTYTSTATISSVETNDSGEYTCTATVTSTSNPGPFLTPSNALSGSLQMFQIKLLRTDNCATWNDDKAYKFQTGIYSQILQEITSRCRCKVTEENLLPGSFSCHGYHNQTTYRSTIIGTQSYNATQLVEFIQDWVTSDPTLTIQWYTVKLDSKCPVSISSLGEPECGVELVSPKVAQCVDVCVARSRSLQ